ncbi:metal ABC transporter permease [Thraustotheca clavata]|uniref:Metal ABC transporter permease n=1 Tax=Thraustotheca clavata TaxID=74557 RepID=A0A1V9Y7M3_9STRA|nr:metal ABC transporter permease [Thraustotheca clavata]
MTLPLGFQTRVGERGLKLSGGDKQRVAIARALLENPRIMILHEATSALDSKIEQKIHNNIIEAYSNQTTIIMTHRLSTVQHAHEIIELDKFEIIDKGSHD